MNEENHDPRTVRIIVQQGANRTFRDYEDPHEVDFHEEVMDMLDSFEKISTF